MTTAFVLDFPSDRDIPVRRLVGVGALGRLPSVLGEIEAKSVALFLGLASLRESANYALIKRLTAGLRVVEIGGVAAEPKLAAMTPYIERLRDARVDAVVGIGGGSVMDVAKVASLMANQDADAWRTLCADTNDFSGISCPGLPLIAIPTTAGSGSEATPYASFDDERMQKLSFASPSLFPRTAIVDANLTLSLPPAITAISGFDALSQGIESFWAVQRSDIADGFAELSIRLAYRHLGQAVLQPSHLPARLAMAQASILAGQAIALTRTTAVHSVSYPITTHFGVPHGHACALTLASFIRYNQEALVVERARRLWSWLGGANAEAAAANVEALMNQVGLERRLGRLGIDARGIEQIVAGGFRPDRVNNNPRELTPGTLQKLLTALL